MRAEQSELDAIYARILSSEKETLRRGEFTEDLASGLAALTIGLYGYYNDNRGVAMKLVYGATQTAGVLLISNAVRGLDRPSLLLSIHKTLRKKEELNYEQYKRMLVRIHEKAERADQAQYAYTGLILSGMYGYSAYRDRKQTALRNVFAFLSLNFLAVSAVNFGKMSTDTKLNLGLELLPPQNEYATAQLALTYGPSWRF